MKERIPMKDRVCKKDRGEFESRTKDGNYKFTCAACCGSICKPEIIKKDIWEGRLKSAS